MENLKSANKVSYNFLILTRKIDKKQSGLGEN